MALHNTYRQLVHRRAAHELELEALGQIPGPHAGGLQGLYHLQGLGHHLRPAAVAGSQGLQRLVQPAVLIETLHQEHPGVHHLWLQLQYPELGEDIIVEVLVVVLYGAEVVKGAVLLLGVLLVVVAVLRVGGLQPLQLAAEDGELVLLVIGLLRLQHRVFLYRLLDVFQKLLGAHL